VSPSQASSQAPVGYPGTSTGRAAAAPREPALDRGREAARELWGSQLALAECSRIDECATWVKKPEALASYARQAGDESLRRLADRIQARALNRAEELLRQMAPSEVLRRRYPIGALPQLRAWPSRATRAAFVTRSGMRCGLHPEKWCRIEVRGSTDPVCNRTASSLISRLCRPL